MKKLLLFATFSLFLIFNACESKRVNDTDGYEKIEEIFLDYSNKLLSEKYDELSLRFTGNISEDSALALYRKWDIDLGQPSGCMFDSIFTEANKNVFTTTDTFTLYISVEQHYSQSVDRKYSQHRLEIVKSDTGYYFNGLSIRPRYSP